MKMFSKFAVAAVMAATSVLAAAEVIDLTAKDFWTPVKNAEFSEGQMTNKGRAMYRSKKLFAFDTTKKYTIEMDISANGPKKAMSYIGFYPATAKGQMQYANAYQSVPASFTEVVADVKKGDKVIKVKDASKWSRNKTTPIALNAKADFSDLPNSKIYNGGIISIVKEGDHWVITLKNPLNVPIAAGSFIRQHLNGGYYYLWYGYVSADKPVKVKSTITGKGKQGGFSRNAFHPAVTHGYIIILSDWGNANTPLTYKNAKLIIE